ncbi:5'-flap endonuclease [Aspergillus wentii]|nr:5'-flap endonuclease [Aspergillus wentii]
MAAADVIVLDSSSPDNPSSRPPPQAPYSPGRIFGLSQYSSPPSLISPSLLFEPSSRSKYFPVESPKDDGKSQNNEKKDSEKPTKKRAPNTAKKTEDGTEDKPKRGRKKATADSQTVLGVAEPSALKSKDNAPKKPAGTRKKRTENTGKRAETKNKTLTGRVAKASSVQTKESGKKVAEPTPPKSATKELDDWGKEGLRLDAAVKRRLDWTPTKDTTKKVFELDTECDAGDKLEPTGVRGFGNLLSEYNFSGTPCPLENLQMGEGGPTKRRRIELVDPNVFPPTKSNTPDHTDKAPRESEQPSAPQTGKNTKRQTKKTTTLTARMTAQYATDDTESLDTSGENTAVEDTGNSKPKRKSRAKAKPQEPEFIVLSPEAAVKSLDDQDLMFGTCSQLEREDSPTMIRDMQTAIHASESHMVSEKIRPNEGTSSRFSSGSSVSRFSKPRNLWSVAARDTDGSLLDVEVLDMVDVSDVSQIPSKDDTLQHSQNQGEKALDSTVIDKKQDDEPPKETSNPREEPPAIAASARRNSEKPEETNALPVQSHAPMPQWSGFTDAELSKQVASYGFKAVRGRKKIIDLLQKCWESKHGTSTNPDGDDRQSNPPETLVSRSTSKQPEMTKKKETKTKPSQNQKPKSQPKAPSDTAAVADAPMIAVARGRQNSSRPPSRSSNTAETKPATPQKTKKRPLAFSFRDIEEIEDSEEEFLPSPSQIQDLYLDHNNTSTQPLSLSAAPSTPTRAAPKSQPQQSTQDTSPQTSLPDLASQITKAVRMQPQLPSIDGQKRLTWHEKILMYDPIILEEFTTWLNTEGLGLIAEDREVSADHRFRAACLVLPKFGV